MRRATILLGWAMLAACSDSTSPPVTPVDAATDEAAAPSPDAGVTGPTKLSETGLYADVAKKTLAPGVLGYDVRYPLWSDGSGKSRYLLLPEGATFDVSDTEYWTFPVGTKVWKHFEKDGKLVETRFLWKKSDTVWFEMGYAWLDDESDAIAQPKGTKSVRGTSHDVPEIVRCHECHDNVVDTVIGLDPMQLSNGPTGMLATLGATGKLSKALPDSEIPGDPTQKAALGYMHGNCGGCHNDHGKFKGQTSLRLRVLSTEKTVEQTGVYRTAFGLKMVHPIPPDITDALVAGDAAHSGIYYRMVVRDGFAMPPYGSKVLDPAGSKAVEAWIVSMGAKDAGAD